MTYGVVRAFQVIVNTVDRLKRLASAVQLRPWPPYFKELSGMVSCPPSPLSVRYFSARSGSVPGYDDGEGLKLEVPLAQSAFSPLLSAAWLNSSKCHHSELCARRTN